MPVSLPAQETGIATVARGGLTVEVRLEPLTITIRRGERTVIGGMTLFGRDGQGTDRLIDLTEGVIVDERLGPRLAVGPATIVDARPDAVRMQTDGPAGPARLEVRIAAADRVEVELEPATAPFRLGAVWAAGAGRAPDRARGATRRELRPGGAARPARRRPRLHRARLPARDARRGRHRTGRLRAGALALLERRLGAVAGDLGRRGRARRARRGRGVPARRRGAAADAAAHAIRHPAARLRHYLRLTGLPPLLPEWGYGHWKSRDVYAHQRDVVDDFEGYERSGMPLDAIVIDSPWETQYNTWRFNPHQFPDARGMIERMRAAGVRTVVWVTPWVNLDSADGQRPPDPESERLHRRPASNYAEGMWAGHYLRGRNGGPHVGSGGWGSAPRSTSARRRRVAGGRNRRGAVLELGVEGIKADDGEGYFIPPEARFADRRTGAEAAWAYGGLYRHTMQEVLDQVHPGTGVLFGRCGWSGQQAVGMTWGGDQVSDFWSLRALVVATLTAAASGFSNWSHDVGGYLGKRLVERCPRELLLRWVQFGCFTPLMQAHGRFEQEAWRYDDHTLDVYRRYVLLHERLVAYIRAAAATAARSGLPIIRPLALTDPGDDRGWAIGDCYGFGPSLWVAPVLEQGATERRAYLPRGRWLEFDPDPGPAAAARADRRRP